MAYCDGCHEDVPSDFTCEVCSRDPRLVTVTCPVVMWDYCGPDTEEIEEYVYYTVCLNCCPGHERPQSGKDNG